MEQSLVQMHRQAPVPDHFEPLLPFHAHLNHSHYASFDQQQRHRHLSQSRAAGSHNLYMSAATTGSATDAVLQQRAFPIRSSQPASTGTPVAPSQQQQHHRQQQQLCHGQHHLAPADATATAAAAAAANGTSGLLGLPQEPRHEHQLRRKTPNGTLDAGYDGSPASLAAGPPPFKQMALPSSSAIFPTAVVQQNAVALQHLQMQRQAAAVANGNTSSLFTSMNKQSAAVPSGSWPYQALSDGSGIISPAAVDQAPLFQSAPLITHLRGNVAGINGANNMLFQPVFAPSYQPSPGPTAFNPPSFTPQPIWPDSALLQGQQAQLGPFSNIVGFVAQQNVAADPNVYLPTAQSMFQTAVLNLNGSFQMPMAAGLFPQPLASAAQLDMSLFHQARQNQAHSHGHDQQTMQMDNSSTLQSPIQALEMLSMGPPSATPNRGIPTQGEGLARFKERVLAYAEKTYADLLLYLTYTKKSLHGRPLPSLRTSTKRSASLKSQQHQQSSRQSSQQPHHSSFADQGGLLQGQMATAQAQQQLMGHHPSNMMGSNMGNPSAQKYSSYLNNPYNLYQASSHDMFSPHLPLISQAKSVLGLLSSLCEQSGWKWIDGMLLGGCLHYGLEHFEQALEWFNRIYALKPDYVEIMSNIAATLYCMDRRKEAEEHWYRAIRTRPSYLEAAEHLASLLVAEHRNREAVDMISFVQNALRNGDGKHNDPAVATVQATATVSDTAGGEPSPDPNVQDAASTQAGFGSSGYAIPGHDNGRILTLIHTKANILYAMKETEAASTAYEEAVLIGAGRNFHSIQTLVRRIYAALLPVEMLSDSQPYLMRQPPGLLLLSPEKAKLTARLVFAGSGGQLPGLRYIPENHHRKSAIATTSNALLSLAKILQDGIASNGYPSQGSTGRSSVIADILALYYLSLSLQESPSTANNVGILLASVQQSSAPSVVEQPRQQSAGMGRAAQNIPAGIPPGSGLALAFAYYTYGLQLDQKHVHLHTNLGSLLKDVGHLDLAIKMYEQAVACDGTFDIALTNLANAVKDRGRVSEAIMYYRRAVASNPEFAEAVCGLSTALNSVCDWRGRGGVVLYNGRYDRWHVDDEGMLRDVRQHGRGSGLTKRVVDIVGRQLREGSTWGRGVLHESAIAMLVSQMKEATMNYDGDSQDTDADKSLDIAAELQKWAGQASEGSRALRLIERATRVVMRCWYQDRHVRGIESPNGYLRPRPPASLAIPAAPTVLPFHTFTCPLPAKDIRLISQRNALRISCSTLRAPWLSGSVYPPPSPPKPQLNVGYISSDFNNHPLAHLMQSVFGFHNPTRAKAFCYATTASDKSVHRQQIEREAPVFRDATNWSPDRLIKQILRDNIHILVNLNGYTRGARNEIFAARPAPIQMAFMGFAGTLGAEWCDYLLADKTAVPPSTLRPWRGNVSIGDVFRDEADADAENWIYSENIIYCRDTFFCCDHKQSSDASERNMTWQDEQRRRWKMRKELFPSLSDDTIIMGNFNQLYKIDPTTFRSWLRILARVPNAVLWLLRFPELGEMNLRTTAALWAGESVASRIIFTDVAPKHQHITRARVCDLFLDTPECNAHTTAADVLWSSTPLLTLPRYEYKMCSRIAASILRGALPKDAEGEQAAAELTAADENQYERTAIELASGLTYHMSPVEGSTSGEVYGNGSGRLADLRQLLWKSKWTCGLFDTRRWVSDLEDAYDEAWRRWISGERGDIYL